MLPEFSYGIIPLQKRGDVWYVLVIQRKEGFWEFPKGHAKHGEKPEDTAAREFHEETGLSVKRFLPRNPMQIQYPITLQGKTIQKVVTYFPAEVEGDQITPQPEELAGGEWLPLHSAMERVTFPTSKALCSELTFLFH